MSRLLPWCITALVLVPVSVAAQQENLNGRKQARATRVPTNAVRLDGRLDEDAWRGAQPILDFVQKEPVEGIPPTDRTEVRFVYDDSALYVGARMFSKSPDAIQAPVIIVTTSGNCGSLTPIGTPSVATPRTYCTAVPRVRWRKPTSARDSTTLTSVHHPARPNTVFRRRARVSVRVSGGMRPLSFTPVAGWS